MLNAAFTGDRETVRHLLASGLRPAFRTLTGVTPLILAAQNGHSAVVAELISGGADIYSLDESGNSALTMAVRHRHVETARILYEAHNPDRIESWTGLYPLHIAAINDDVWMIRMLLREGAQIDGRSGPGSDEHGVSWESASALHLACRYHSVNAARELIIAGADINAVDQNGDTPIIVASREHLYDLVEILSDYEAVLPVREGRGDRSDGRNPFRRYVDHPDDA